MEYRAPAHRFHQSIGTVTHLTGTDRPIAALLLAHSELLYYYTVPSRVLLYFYSTVLYSAVLYNTVLYSAIQYNTMLYYTIQCCMVTMIELVWKQTFHLSTLPPVPPTDWAVAGC